MEEFKTGNVVQLKSGGPLMTIECKVEDLKGSNNYTALKMKGISDDFIVCKFWDESEKEFQTEYFDPKLLELSK